MSCEVRSYLIDDEGQPRPIARTRRRRLLEHAAAFADYAGRRVRCAHVVLGDAAVRQEAYSLVRLDAQGRVAPDDALRWLHLVVATDGLDPGGERRGLAWPEVTRGLATWRPDAALRQRVLELAGSGDPGTEKGPPEAAASGGPTITAT